MRYVKNYEESDIEISVQDVVRYLGYQRRKRDIAPHIQNTIEQQITSAYSLIRPEGVYSLFGNTTFKEHPLFGDAQKIALGICTIGQAFDNAVAMHFKNREYLEGLILDAAGTVALENVAELLRREIKERTSEEGFVISRRFSPGEGDWGLDGQTLIFQYFSDENVGISLNESGMMHPRKSLSFAYTFVSGAREESRGEDCQCCSISPRCRYRKNDIRLPS
jgi:hypothetical protein